MNERTEKIFKLKTDILLARSRGDFKKAIELKKELDNVDDYIDENGITYSIESTK